VGERLLSRYAAGMNALRLIPCAALLLASCGDGGPGISPSGDDQTRLQTALIEALDGEVVELGSGTFELTDVLEISGKTDLTIRGQGMDETILDFSGQEVGGAGLDLTNMTRVIVEDLAIMDAQGNGLRINGSDGVVGRRVRAGWTNESDTENGKYAIYPVQSDNVLVEESEALNSSDAGFYMGQVENGIMRNNVARGNVAGFEVENSINCEVYDNLAEDNTGGILVFELPGLPMNGAGTLVRDNEARANNRENFGEPGSTVGLIPAGTGIFILAANDVEIRNNVIADNRTLGIAVTSYDTVLALENEDGTGDPDYDTLSEDIYIHDNELTNNGTDPGTPGDAIQMLLGFIMTFTDETFPDGLENVVFDGWLPEGGPSGALCLGTSDLPTFIDIDVEGVAAEANGDATRPIEISRDTSPHECEGTPRPSVTLDFEG
jgi:parallel beta-helix repeat protein